MVAVTAVLAVTTDLGDDFYAKDLSLIARLVGGQTPQKIFAEGTFSWQGHLRALKIVLHCPSKNAACEVRLHVTSYATELQQGQKSVPYLLDVWSAPFRLADKGRAELMVERRLTLPNGSKLRILEQTEESIARHIWDASLGFLQYFERAGLGIDKASAFHKLVSQKKAKPLRVIELGAGCGIVGIAFAQLVKSEVLLTDLDDAVEICHLNVQTASLAAGSLLTVSVLDWSEELNDMDGRFDVVLVSDCIYNPDSSVHLVRTLQMLSRQQPSPLILVGYKRRHSEDEVFCEHMQQAGFTTLNTASIQLPHRRSDHDVDYPTTEFYGYRMPT